MMQDEVRSRRSLRLKAYDYASPGAYFVTLVCKDREQQFAEAKFRDIAEREWQWLARYDHVKLDEYVVMPNHFHAILLLTEGRGGSRTAPTGMREMRKPLGRLIGAFKTNSTREINALRDTPGVPVWQRNYFEHVVRNEAELNRIRQYIRDNPSNWENDPADPVIGRRGSVRDQRSL